MHLATSDTADINDKDAMGDSSRGVTHKSQSCMRLKASYTQWTHPRLVVLVHLTQIRAQNLTWPHWLKWLRTMVSLTAVGMPPT